MHIIQYLLNLPFNNIVYNGSGKIRIIGKADSNFTVFQFRSILKFKPDDIGYDIRGVEWRIISVYSNNNIYTYEAFNGTEIVTFNNFSLYNAAEINAIFQNNLDSEIEIIANKIKQLENYIPQPEKDPYLTILKFNVDDIAYDIFGIEWRITSIYENNGKYEILAVSGNEEKTFCISQLYTASEIEAKYQSVLSVEIDKIIFKINQLDAIIPDDETNQLYNKIIKFRSGDVGYDLNGIQYKVMSVFYENNQVKIYANNNNQDKIFLENDLFTASEANKAFQTHLDEKIESVLEKINFYDSLLYKEKIAEDRRIKQAKKYVTPKPPPVKLNKKLDQNISITKIIENKISKGDVCLDKKNNEWLIVEIFYFNNKPKYQGSRKGSTKIFNEKDLKKKSN